MRTLRLAAAASSPSGSSTSSLLSSCGQQARSFPPASISSSATSERALSPDHYLWDSMHVPLHTQQDPRSSQRCHPCYGPAGNPTKLSGSHYSGTSTAPATHQPLAAVTWGQHVDSKALTAVFDTRINYERQSANGSWLQPSASGYAPHTPAPGMDVAHHDMLLMPPSLQPGALTSDHQHALPAPMPQCSSRATSWPFTAAYPFLPSDLAGQQELQPALPSPNMQQAAMASWSALWGLPTDVAMDERRPNHRHAL